MPLRQLRAQNAKAWERLGEKERALKLVEANVKAGVQTVRQNGFVVEAMKSRGLVVHGLIYNIGTGILEEVDVKEGKEEMAVREEAFEMK